MVQGRNLADHFSRIFGPDAYVRADVPASEVTTIKAGGMIECLVQPSRMEELIELFHACNKDGIPLRILGNGSNVLINDCGVNGVTLRLGRSFSGWQFSNPDLRLAEILAKQPSSKSQIDFHGPDSVQVFAFAACPLPGLSRQTAELGLAGLEFAGGIPASVGGAVRMNAGAHGSDMSAVLSRVLTLDAQGNLNEINANNLKFSYRQCQLEKGSLILGAEISLQRENVDDILARREESLAHRRRTQPLNLPSAGSVFRNPGNSCGDSGITEKIFAGALLEKAGLKGVAKGGMSYSTLHANWIVKTGSLAQISELEELVEIGQQRVFQASGVQLQTEVIFWRR